MAPSARRTGGQGWGRRPSGQQVEIRFEEQVAVVVEVGGGLRTYDVGDRRVLDGYGADERVTGARASR